MKFKALLSVATLCFSIGVFAQCPKITCPSNITIGSDSGMCSAIVNYTTPIGIDSCGGGTQIFNYTGSVQVWTVPNGITSVDITCYGAAGATSVNPANGNGIGGLGGTSTGTLAVSPGNILNIYVGQAGQVTTQGSFSGGGFNGGGNGSGAYATGWFGGGGGGASDVRYGGTALSNRVIVAGGGGGGGSNGSTANGNAAGDGGGTIGGNGVSVTGLGEGNGGTQSAGGTAIAYGWDCGSATAGTPGVLGNGGTADVCSSGGGGGGGYYGGGGGDFGGGGGGSAYIGGVTSGTTTAGTQSGNGQVVLSYGSPATTTLITGLGTGSAFPVGVTTETYVVVGVSGPNDTCNFTVTVVDSGQATVLPAFSTDTICSSASAIALPTGSPAGGTYSGIGVVGSNFDPASSGIGSFWVYYTDTVGCASTDSTLITVEVCAGISQMVSQATVTISPNPSTGFFNINIAKGSTVGTAEVFDMLGNRVVSSTNLGSSKHLDLSSQSKGIYFLKLDVNGDQEIFRLVKN